jgi:hypothetical protein
LLKGGGKCHFIVPVFRIIQFTKSYHKHTTLFYFLCIIAFLGIFIRLEQKSVFPVVSIQMALSRRKIGIIGILNRKLGSNTKEQRRAPEKSFAPTEFFWRANQFTFFCPIDCRVTRLQQRWSLQFKKLVRQTLC